MMGPTAVRPRFSSGQEVPTDIARYRIIEPLGSGGNSDVYLCQAIAGRNQGLLLALKLMVRVDRPDRVERFRVELEFLRAVDHPGLMRVFDNGTHVFGPPANRQEVPFYVAEYLPSTLKETIRTGLSTVEKASIALQLVSSLAFLSRHSPPIVHRDIKPENIFIRGRTPVIGDFGLLKAIGPAGVSETFTLDELSRGVRFPRLYPTPELIEYAKDKDVDVTSKSDMFQMGIVFCEMFADFYPIEDRAKPLDPIAVRDLPEFRGTQGQVIRGVAQRMLEMDPVRRPMPEDELDHLDGAFREIASDARRLEGRVFLFR